jgi:hypothetical protein
VEYREALRIGSGWENELGFLYFKSKDLVRKLPEASDGEFVPIAWGTKSTKGCAGFYMQLLLFNPRENKK